jgi:hypothetical protein
VLHFCGTLSLKVILKIISSYRPFFSLLLQQLERQQEHPQQELQQQEPQQLQFQQLYEEPVLLA